MAELKPTNENIEYYIDELGRAYKYKKTADLVREAENLSREISYEPTRIDAEMAMHRAVGCVLMAEELEPYNPNVLESVGFIIDLSKKSTDYMLALTDRVIYRISTDESREYPEFQTTGWFKKVLPKIRRDLERDVTRGKIYQWV